MQAISNAIRCIANYANFHISLKLRYRADKLTVHFTVSNTDLPQKSGFDQCTILQFTAV